MTPNHLASRLFFFFSFVSVGDNLSSKVGGACTQQWPISHRAAVAALFCAPDYIAPPVSKGNAIFSGAAAVFFFFSKSPHFILVLSKLVINDIFHHYNALYIAVVIGFWFICSPTSSPAPRWNVEWTMFSLSWRADRKWASGKFFSPFPKDFQSSCRVGQRPFPSQPVAVRSFDWLFPIYSSSSSSSSWIE